MSVAPSTLDINELFDVSSQVETEDVPNGESPKKKQKENGQFKDIKDVEIPPLPEVARQDLIARNYQIELFEKAKKDNVIAVLDTGSGKTFIAVMLIKEIAAKERLLRMQRRETKLTFFLVNLVPLVFQQANVIEANCDLKVKHFCGEMGVDLWSEKEWRKNFENYDVLVMTAQIFLNILRHGFISLSQVNLLVFDECHHASKKHPYNLIMREFYDRCPEESKPKIFGMTASPVNTRSALHSASHLEHNLNARVFTASDTDEVCKFVSRPDEISIKYDSPPRYAPTELFNKLKEEYLDVEKFSRALLSAQQALQALGPWCSDRVWKYILDEMHEKSEGKLSPELCAESQEEERLVRKAMDIVNEWNFQPPKCEQEVLSPKVIQLINILKCFKDQTDNFCGIVFVERRHTANVLHLLIKETEELYFIKSGVLVGHGSHEEGDLQMKFKEQNKTINAFRDGRINLLIATNVAEEGLDIQPCNVVIRFDFFNTLRAYIQSRGRARRKDSKYIVMIENNNLKEYGTLREMKQAEKDMKDWCQMLPEDRKLLGALLSYESAISLVYYYCSKLPGDNYCILRPDFKIERENGGGFTCHLSLPNNAPIRLVTSEVSSSRSNAKKAASFKACLQLYEKKALNDHLLPEIEWIEEDHEMTKPVKDEYGLVEGARKSKREYNRKNPDLWNNDEEEMPSIPDKIYVTILKLELEDEKYDGQYYRTMCLLTRKQLPEVPPITLYFHSVARVMNVLPHSVPISIESEDLEIIFKFTLRTFTSIINKEFVCEFEKFTYLVAPLVRNAPINENFFDYIDWEGMRRAVTEKQLPIDLDNISDLEDAVIIDYSDNLRRYFVQQICHDLNPLSPIPDGMAIREVGCKNFAEFYKKHFDLELKHTEQPLLHVRKISKVMNFLQPVPGSLPILKGRTATYVIPEFCKQYPIRASVFRSALMLPAIFTRLDSQLLAMELGTRFEIPIRDDLLLEAITTPSANMEMNYERLETLGDSFLKFCVTNRLYVMFPDKHEGQLHCQRIRIICNRQLYRGAKKLHLYEYITSSPFNRRTWRPANMLANIDDVNILKQNKVHELADKTLADVVEAMLGAAYMSGQVDAALKCSIALDIQMEDITKWNDFHANNKNRPRVNAKALDRVNVERIEEICGHTFKNKILIVEALTHASLPNSATPCYQRLEFLGDAVLDFMTVKYLFEKYPDGAPGIMTDLKDAAVNNQVLGAICERINLHKHIIHFSSKLTGGITEFVNAVNELREKNEAVGEYWSELDVPKVMSDVVESMMGAIFVDSEFDPAALQNVFDKWIKPILTEHVTPETLKVHPVKKLTEYMQKEGCLELLLRNHTSEESDTQQCTIFIHETPVAHASSTNIRSARKLAAQEILDKIDDPKFLDNICTCIRTRSDSLFNDDDDEVLLD
ncbi:22395_t:CDS:2 [Racocetra persica]|uniref:22395_t:CDS:1 n=1 Tax=Racocetra persica TaxID=160502 RepID=A0ACA9M046_9GLOM|nr:22395_t:CDS:2 [Racocetra persica]